MRSGARDERTRLSLDGQLCGRFSSAWGSIKIGIKTNDRQVVLFGHRQLVGVIKVKPESLGEIHDRGQVARREGKHQDTCFGKDIAQKQSESVGMLASEQKQRDRVQTVIGNMQRMGRVILKNSSGLVGLGLRQQKLQKHICVNEQSHAPSLLHRATWC